MTPQDHHQEEENDGASPETTFIERNNSSVTRESTTRKPPFAAGKQLLSNVVKNTYTKTESNIQKGVEKVQHNLRLHRDNKGYKGGETRKHGNFFGKSKAMLPGDTDGTNSSLSRSNRNEDVHDHDHDRPSSNQMNNTRETTEPVKSAASVPGEHPLLSSPSLRLDPRRDPTALAILLLSLVAKYTTFQSWETLQKNGQVPLFVMLAWVAVASLVGREVGAWQTRKAFEERWASTGNIPPKMTSETSWFSNRHLADPASSSPQSQQQEPRRYFSRTRAVMANLFSHNTSATAEEKGESKLRFWTTLGKDSTRKRQRWELFGNVLVSKSLTNAVLRKAPKEQRKSLRDLGVSEKELEEVMSQDQSPRIIGTIYVDDLEKLRATSLEDTVVEPLCRLRGLDVFLTDAPETDIGNHSFLIKHGLRDSPTFLINVLTQWGNIMLYFEFPDWLQDWDSIVEHDDDPENVIATKRFLNGNDAYRNERLKFLPCLVDGPGPIRYLAPAKKTKTIVSPRIPSTWKKHPPKIDENGSTVWHPCLEFECDLMANGAMRSVSSMVKRYLGSMVADAAVMIEKPDLQEESKPTACLGMIRFDRIDVSGCSALPPRLEEGETEIERDMHRASVFVGKRVVQ